MLQVYCVACCAAVLGRTETVHGAAHSNDWRTGGEAHSVQGDGRTRCGGEEQDPGRCRGSVHGSETVSPRHQEVHSVWQQSQGLPLISSPTPVIYRQWWKCCGCNWTPFPTCSLWLKMFPRLKFPEYAWEGIKGMHFTSQKSSEGVKACIVNYYG